LTDAYIPVSNTDSRDANLSWL